MNLRIMVTTEINNELENERINEIANEVEDGYYSDWLSDNIKDLKEEFIKDNKAEFDEMLKQEIIDEDRDMDYWKDVFCKEEMEEEFLDYCKEEYNVYRDINK